MNADIGNCRARRNEVISGSERMTLIKSILVGLLSVLGLAIATPFVALVVASLLPAHKSDGAWGWDPVSFARSPLSWTIFVVIFAAGFVWEYRRLRS